MKIQILPSEVVDQIAAGEVVERPSHLLKELIENSLDAGSTEIIVDFALGGRFVKVIDNGTGISADDLPKALLRFATSKINTTNDLWRLQSYGFRGEALASIASVSQLTLFSSDNESGYGFRLLSRFGQMGQLEKVSRSRGTTIIVEELFQNVPARLKFMKSDASEAMQIKQTLKALALSRPDVSFRLLQENKLIALWPSRTHWRERIEEVLEIKPLYEGQAVRGSIKARAFFASPDEVQKTSKMIWIFAQGRAIQDKSIQAAVMEAYRNLLMHGEFPVACVFVESPPDQIDVNIHPTKSQVKFLLPQDVFRSVQAAVKSTLEQAPWIPKGGPEKITPYQYSTEDSPALDYAKAKNKTFDDPAFNTTMFRKREENKNEIFLNLSTFEKRDSELKPFVKDKPEQISEPQQFKNAKRDPSDLDNPNLASPHFGSHKLESQCVDAQNLDFSHSKIQFTETHFDKLSDQLKGESHPENLMHSESQNKVSNLTEQNKGTYWSSLEVLGQAGLTYIVCQSASGLILVDQHAAHERVVFEKLRSRMHLKKTEVQKFLFPLALDMTEEKCEALKLQKETLFEMGIHLEELGPTTIGITAAPSILKDQVLVKELDRFAQEVVDNGVGTSIDKALHDICASLACHSVVRAGQSLSLTEMRNLLQQMDEFPLSGYCPHGRPVSVELKWSRLEKDFGRTL